LIVDEFIKIGVGEHLAPPLGAVAGEHVSDIADLGVLSQVPR
jgi:hypothetical protein